MKIYSIILHNDVKLGLMG